MNIEFLGHASLVVRWGDDAVLFDPLLLGLHQQGLYDVYPHRSLDLSELPPLSAVVLSHAHSDHFDVPSLALIPRETPMFVAADPLILNTLASLGFSDVVPIRDWLEFEIGDLRITATSAAEGALEHGFIITDGPSVVWNMVDTFPTPSGIAEAKRRFSTIDLLVPPWQPLQDTVFPSGNPISFPFRFYARAIANIIQIEPQALVPGACGFRAVGAAAWTNSLLFPVTRQRFVEDITTACPQLEGRVFEMDPGEALIVSPHGIAKDSEKLSYCRAEQYAWEVLSYRPYELGFTLTDARREASSYGECFETVRLFFETALPAYVATHPEAFFWHRRWRVRHQYEVVFSDQRATWFVEFGSEPLVSSRGSSPLATSTTLVTAGAIVGLLAGRLAWDLVVLAGEYRFHDHTYAVSPRGVEVPSVFSFVDPLRLLLGGDKSEELAVGQQVAEVLRREVRAGAV